jgi:class 3 adenylate cyclase
VQWIASAVAAALALLFLWRLMVTRRRLRSLQRRVDASAASLENMQQSFARFAPAEVVEAIVSQGVSTRSEKKEVTVLFADLRGFTQMSEKLDPAQLVQILNGYFEEMSRAITTHRGHVSKFIGDGIMALFGALEPNPWHTNDAVHAALAMRAALAAYNERLRARGLPVLSLGIGVHRGQVVAGVIGSAQLMEYTVIGANVNLAARVESATRNHDVDILITRAVRDALDPRFTLREMPPITAKGVSEPVVTFAVEKFA